MTLGFVDVPASEKMNLLHTAKTVFFVFCYQMYRLLTIIFYFLRLSLIHALYSPLLNTYLSLWVGDFVHTETDRWLLKRIAQVSTKDVGFVLSFTTTEQRPNSSSWLIEKNVGWLCSIIALDFVLPSRTHNGDSDETLKLRKLPNTLKKGDEKYLVQGKRIFELKSRCRKTNCSLCKAYVAVNTRKIIHAEKVLNAWMQPISHVNSANAVWRVSAQPQQETQWAVFSKCSDSHLYIRTHAVRPLDLTSRDTVDREWRHMQQVEIWPQWALSELTAYKHERWY